MSFLNALAGPVGGSTAGASANAGVGAAAAFPWMAALGLGLSGVNALIGGYSGKKQASAIKNAAQAAEVTNQRGARAALELSAPQIEVGHSALMTLAQMYGLPVPESVNVNRIASGLNPTPGDMVSLGGRNYVDPTTGQRYKMAHKGADTGQLYAKGGVDPNYAPGGSMHQPNAMAGGGGGSAPSKYEDLNALITNNPGIQFVNEQGQDAIAKQNAARGRYLSGAQTKDATRYAQGNAATNYQNMVINPLFGLAGYAPQGTAQGTSIINNLSANSANNAYTEGVARASGYGTAANAAGNFVNSLNTALPEFENWYRNR